MAVVHLVVLASEGKVALADGDLPTVSTTELFSAGEVVGFRVAVVRTLVDLEHQLR